MKRFAFFLTAIMLLPLFAFSQIFNYADNWGKSGFSLLENKSSVVKINYSIKQFSMSDKEIDGKKMKVVNLPNVFLPNDEGMPNLPGESKLIAIPEGSTPVLEIVDYRTEVIKNVEIAPAPKIPLVTDDQIIYQKNDKVYSKNENYPKSPVKISTIKQIRGVDAVMIGITPFQYNPVKKELTVYKDIEVEVSFKGGTNYFGEDKYRSLYWENILDDMLINYESLPEIDFSEQNNKSKDDEADYVIITIDDADFIAKAEEIAEFRRKQGISTMVVTTTDVGGNTVSAIEAWVDDAYNNWSNPVDAVLLLGDYSTGSDGIISHLYNHPSSWYDDYASDNKYADVDNDDLPEINFARITAENTDQLDIMVSKFMDYEQNPPTSSNFYDNPITALGWQTERWFQICSETVRGFWENELGKSPVHINNIYSGTPGSSWSTATNTSTVTNYFGPSGLGYIPASPSDLGGSGYWNNGSTQAVVDAINSGAFMLQHRDHGSYTGWGEPDFQNVDINSLTNVDNKLPYIFSINCQTGAYHNPGDDPCFAEAFHRYTYNGQNSGALGLIAATEVSYSFVNDTYVWGLYDNMWDDFMPDYDTEYPVDFVMPGFGNAAAKHFLYQSSWPYNTDNKQVTYRLFHHHGDAYMNVYTEVPQDLSVSCPDVHIFGTGSIDITADDGATIAVTYYDDIEQKSIILGTAVSSGGNTSITLNPQPDPGTELLVTITKQDYFRYTKNVTVISPSGPYIVQNSISIDDEQGNDNGEADYRETFNIDVTLENVGSEDATNVTATVTTSDPYVESLTNNENISFGSIAADETATSSDAFTVTMADSLPDQYKPTFDIQVEDDSKASYDYVFNFPVNAPILASSHQSINDVTEGLSFLTSPQLEVDEFGDYNYNISVYEIGGNGDGKLDPGERAQIIYKAENIGHADFYHAKAILKSLSDDVTVLSDTFEIGTIGAQDYQIAKFTIVVNGSTPIGTVAELRFVLFSGDYSGQVYKERLLIGFNIGIISEDFETGDFSNYNWQLSGDADWTVQSNTVYEGSYSAQSGDITDDQTTTLEISGEVLSNGEISFYAKTSSESSYDFFTFYIDGTEKGSWSGDVDWQQYTYDVTAGNHTFTWEYEKDGSMANGDDCGYLDNILFPGMNFSKSKSIVITANPLPSWLSIQDNGNGTAQIFGTAPEAPSGNDLYDVKVIALKDTMTIFQEFSITVRDVTSIDNKNVEIKIYPNPIENMLNIELPDKAKDAQVKIFDMSGKLLVTEKLTSLSNQINVDLTGGFYLLEVQYKDNKYTKRIMVQ